MLGNAAKNDVFADHIDWDNANPCPWDAANVNEIIDEAMRDQTRIPEMRRHNVTRALQEHDWVYRWRKSQLADSAPTEKMQARKAELLKLADEVKIADDLTPRFFGLLPSVAMSGRRATYSSVVSVACLRRVTLSHMRRSRRHRV